MWYVRIRQKYKREINIQKLWIDSHKDIEIDNKHIKRPSVSWIVIEIQTDIFMAYTFLVR